jgi:hypothetical protein
VFDFLGDILGGGGDFFHPGAGSGAFEGAGAAFEGAGDWFASHGARGMHGWSAAQFGEAEGLLGRILGGNASALDGIKAFASRFGHNAGPILEEYLNYKAYEAFSGNKSHSWQNWQKAGDSAKEFAAHSEVIKSHSVLRANLEKYAPGSELLNKYRELGINLPDDDTLKKVKRTLSKLHPDKNQVHGGEGLMGEIYQAIDVLKNKGKTGPYRDILERAKNDPGLRGRIEGLFKDLSGFCEKAASHRAKMAKLRLPFNGQKPEEMNTAQRFSYRIYNNLKNSSPTRQGAIIFGVVTGTALLGYGVMRYVENKKSKSPVEAKSHVEALEKQQAQKSMAL